MDDDLFDFVEEIVSNKKSSNGNETKGGGEGRDEGKDNEEMFKGITEEGLQEMVTKTTLLKENISKHIKELEEENLRLKGEVNKSMASQCPSCNHINGRYPKTERQVEGCIYVDGKTLRLTFDNMNDMKKFYYDNKLHLFDK
uniref:Uncharacterized protein n=1 Tax=Strongyloides papillosus TaxID=174720 RepID=A0A0N5BUI8_STREA